MAPLGRVPLGWYKGGSVRFGQLAEMIRRVRCSLKKTNDRGMAPAAAEAAASNPKLIWANYAKIPKNKPRSGIMDLVIKAK